MPSSSGSHPGSPMPFASFRRSILSVRSEQIHSETSRQSESPNLDSFHERVFSRFNSLSVMNPDELLSLSWILKLLDAFNSCLEDFKAILCGNTTLLLSKPPADRLAAEYFDRSIKAMDIFNAARDGVETIRTWQKHLEIVVCALDTKHRAVGEGQFRRARKALMDLALVMLHEKDSAGSIFSYRNRSFGQKGKDHGSQSSSGHSRSLSWSVSNSWSASKQLQSMAYNLVAPRANEIAATDGFAILVFSMSFILMFVLWVLVAAIPCQDRGSLVHFSIPRQFSWSMPVFLLHSRIVDESKKRDRRNSSGLLKEIHQTEKCMQQMTDSFDAAQFPLPEEFKQELLATVQELSSVCEVLKNGLDPLERKLRETFRKVMNCRSEGLELLGKATQP